MTRLWVEKSTVTETQSVTVKCPVQEEPESAIFLRSFECAAACDNTQTGRD